MEKRRLGDIDFCGFCGAEYEVINSMSKFCCKRCLNGLKNEKKAREAKERGVTIREAISQIQLENILIDLYGI